MMYEIPADLENLINAEMASGKYKSPDELLRDALQTLALQRCTRDVDSTTNGNGTALDDLNRRGLVGSVRSGHNDLSTNPTHMKGFGKSGN